MKKVLNERVGDCGTCFIGTTKTSSRYKNPCNFLLLPTGESTTSHVLGGPTIQQIQLLNHIKTPNGKKNSLIKIKLKNTFPFLTFPSSPFIAQFTAKKIHRVPKQHSNLVQVLLQ